MKYPQLPIFAFLAAVLVLVPIPWHWRARNIATLSIIFWLFVGNIIYGINALIWAGNFDDRAPVWCDITTKIVVGASFALPLATICVCKHLEMVSSTRTVKFDVADRRRRMIFEIVMCFGIPLVFMALHYIVQGHRFDIIEDIGCQATIYISIPAIFLMWFPPLLFSTITFIYAAMALHHFVTRRLVFAAHLQNSNSAITTNRYLRLIAMSLTEMIWGTSLNAFNLWNNVEGGLRPWTNWADVHSNFSRVDPYPAVTIPPVFLDRMYLFWSVMPASAVIFFLFFGFGEEAKKEYHQVWHWFLKTILRRQLDGRSNTFGSLSSSRLRSFHLPNSASLKDSTETKLGMTSASDTTLHAPPPYIPMPAALQKALDAKEDSERDKESIRFSNLSYYEYSHASAYAPTPSTSCFPPTPSTIHADKHDSHSRSGSPAPSVPLSVHSDELDDYDTEESPPPAPMFHRPFSPPTVYPMTLPQPRTRSASESAAVVTTHRQVSVDNVVLKICP